MMYKQEIEEAFFVELRLCKAITPDTLNDTATTEHYTHTIVGRVRYVEERNTTPGNGTPVNDTPGNNTPGNDMPGNNTPVNYPPLQQ